MATAKNLRIVADEADTEDTTVSFEFDGETYEYDREVLDDAELLEAIDDNKLSHAAKAVVGEKQYARFREKRRKIKDVADFCEAAFTASGSDLGK